MCYPRQRANADSTLSPGDVPITGFLSVTRDFLPLPRLDADTNYTTCMTLITSGLRQQASKPKFMLKPARTWRSLSDTRVDGLPTSC